MHEVTCGHKVVAYTMPRREVAYACFQVISGGHIDYRSMKLLSVDPENYRDAPTEGIRRVLEAELEKPMPRDTPVDTSNILSIRMGTTVCPTHNAVSAKVHKRIVSSTTTVRSCSLPWKLDAAVHVHHSTY